MLNRRVIRIRIMQDLYAYFINMRAICSIREDKVGITGAKLKKDPTDINDQKENSIASTFSKEETIIDCFIKLAPSVNKNEKVDDDRETFFAEIKNLNSILSRGLQEQENHIYINYWNVIYLLIKWMNTAKFQANITKKYQTDYQTHNTVKFLNNKILNNIKNSNSFKTKINDTKLIFDENEIKIWYNKFVKKDKFFIKYCLESTDISDYQIIEYIFKQIILNNPIINIFFKEVDPMWETTVFILKNLLLKTFMHFQNHDENDENNENDENFEINNIIQSQEVFYQNFIKKIEQNWNHINELITQKLKNWNLERLFLIDKILISMAANEILFDKIPSAIVINEYVEISKIYSTPKSSKFINGMLSELSQIN